MTELSSAQNPLGTDKIGRLMLRFAIPCIISIVVNSLYNMVDQVFIGQGVGYLGNAATNIILPLVTVMISTGMLIGDGAAAFMCLSLGRGKADDASRGIGTAIMLTIAAGILLGILFQVFLEPLCRFFGGTPENLSYALEYGRIIVLGFPFAIINTSFTGMIRSDGRARESMIGLLIGCITNIILDPVFILVFRWGVAGAAWATIIGQALNAMYFIWCVTRFRTICLHWVDLLPRISVVARIIPLGLSSFINQFAGVFVMYVLNTTLVAYGAMSQYGPDIPLAALGITQKANQLVTGIAVGIAAGIQPILGYNYGSGQFDRVKKAFKLSVFWGTAFMLAVFVVFQVFPEQIVLLFGQESDLYMDFAVRCFRTYLFCCWLIPVGTAVGFFYQSVGKPVQASILSLSRQVLILIPAIIIFARIGGVGGVLWAGAFSDGLAALVAVLLIVIDWKKMFRLEKKDDAMLK